MYTSPAEVQITVGSNQIQDAYVAAFKKRYGIEPFIETDDLTTFSFLCKNFGLEEGKRTVEHYLTMNDQWFVTKAHDVRSIRGNLNKIRAGMGHPKQHGEIRMNIPLTCDKCHQPFLWLGTAEQLDKEPRLCKECIW